MKFNKILFISLIILLISFSVVSADYNDYLNLNYNLISDAKSNISTNGYDFPLTCGSPVSFQEKSPYQIKPLINFSANFGDSLYADCKDMYMTSNVITNFTSYNSSFSVTLWFLINDSISFSLGGLNLFSLHNDDNFDESFGLAYAGNINSIGFEKGYSTGSLSTSIFINETLDKWYFVAGTYNKTTGDVMVYLDGKYTVNTGDGYSAQLSLGNTLRLGTYSSSGVVSNNIANVRFYNTTLTTNELSLIMGEEPIPNPPSKVNITSPNSSLSVTLNSTGVSVYFNWTNSTDLDGDSVTYDLKLEKIINYTLYSGSNSYFNATFYSDNYTGVYNYYVVSKSTNLSNTTKSDYAITFCTNEWVKTSVGDCVGDLQNYTYIDANNCDDEYSKPSDGQDSCTTPTPSDDTDWFILVFLMFIVGLLIVLSFLVHPSFMGVAGLLIGVLTPNVLLSMFGNTLFTILLFLISGLLILVSVMMTISDRNK